MTYVIVYSFVQLTPEKQYTLKLSPTCADLSSLKYTWSFSTENGLLSTYTSTDTNPVIKATPNSSSLDITVKLDISDCPAPDDTSAHVITLSSTLFGPTGVPITITPASVQFKYHCSCPQNEPTHPVGVTPWLKDSGPFATKQAYSYGGYAIFNSIPYTDTPFPLSRPTIAWFVRDISLTQSQLPTSSSSISFNVTTDDGCQVFVNGTKVHDDFSSPHAPRKFNIVTEAPNISSLFHEGINRIAVKVQNGYESGSGPGAMYTHLSINGVDYITDGGVDDKNTYGQDSSLWEYCFTCGTTIDPDLIPSEWVDASKYFITICTGNTSDCVKGCD